MKFEKYDKIIGILIMFIIALQIFGIALNVENNIMTIFQWIFTVLLSFDIGMTIGYRWMK